MSTISFVYTMPYLANRLKMGSPPAYESPNALRHLFEYYGGDRLMGAKSEFLSPIGLEFLDAAKMLLEAGNNWGAILMAIASFEEKLAQMAVEAGIEIQEGRRLDAIAEELQEQMDKLRTKGSINSVHQEAFARIIELLPAFCSETESMMTQAKVTELIVALATIEDSRA